MIWFNVILFVIGLLMLIKGGDWFVDGASGIARRFHLPELLIGATVVSIGTTLPEVMVSAQGAISGSGDIAYGNAIGSIICNTALIAAITIAIKPSKTERKALAVPVAFFFIAAAFYVFVAYFFGEFARWVGIALLGLFVVYIVTTLVQMKKTPSKEIDGLVELSEESLEAEEPKDFSIKGFIFETFVVVTGGAALLFRDEIFKLIDVDTEDSGSLFKVIAVVMILVFVAYAAIAIVRRCTNKKPLGVMNEIFYIVIGAAVIAGGANLLVESGQAIAISFGVPETVIALTFVALGTSLPELVTAITSLVKGHGALSLGNIIGANIFNLVLVSGVATTIAPFGVPSESQLAGHPMSLVLDIPVMLGVMLILTLPAIIGKKLSRAQGIILLCVYAAFCTVQFVI